MRTQHAILGAGCAGLSLAAKLASHKEAPNCALIGMPDDRPNHGWGFWQMPWLDRPARLARKKWTCWQFIDADQTITHESIAHPYHLLESQKWLAHCQAEIEDSPLIWLKETVKSVSASTIQTDRNHLTASQIYDSRPPQPANDILWQHFLGQEIQSTAPVFDPDTAILMDFRVSQEKGLHFIYLLPFSAHNALVESTYFSPEPVPAETYRATIKGYLSTHFKLANYEVMREEKGQIPMGPVFAHQEGLTGLGGNGGAIRPSSGYAFAFIQKQIAQMIAEPEIKGRKISAPAPVHGRRDLWMDRVFLEVLRKRPDLGPGLFLSMASQLTGDEMARFMSGTARWSDLAKVMWAMPKGPFIKAGLSQMITRQPRRADSKTCASPPGDKQPEGLI